MKPPGWNAFSTEDGFPKFLRLFQPDELAIRGNQKGIPDRGDIFTRIESLILLLEICFCEATNSIFLHEPSMPLSSLLL